MVSDIQAGGGKIANFFYSVAVYADKRKGRRANFNDWSLVFYIYTYVFRVHIFIINAIKKSIDNCTMRWIKLKVMWYFIQRT